MTTSSRYSRQSILADVGDAGQAQISEASILCVGAGGLGCPALLYLAAAGIGRIGIIDFDVVEESNLQRQVLFDTSHVGQKKAIAAKARLESLNPNITVESYVEALSDQNAVALFENFDLIIDGSDNFATKFLVNDAALKTGKPFIYGSILGFEGQISVFNHQGGPCYRCLFSEPPQNYIPNCADAGVIGAVAGMIGTMQAMEAIKLIVDGLRVHSLSGTLKTIDARNIESRILTLNKDVDCPACSIPADHIVLDYSSPLCGIVDIIAPTDLNESDVLIDVREQDEWEAGYIPGARHIALSHLMEEQRPNLDKDTPIILYCQKGKRGEQAASILKANGFENVRNMDGGYEAWIQHFPNAA